MLAYVKLIAVYGMNSMLSKPAAGNASAEVIARRPEPESGPRTYVSRKYSRSEQRSERAHNPSSQKSSEQSETHFADFEFKRGTDVGVRLPIGHQWACNASLTSWSDILGAGLRQHVPSIYLCERHAIELGLHW